VIDFSQLQTSISVPTGVSKNVLVYSNGAVSLENLSDPIPPDAVIVAQWNGSSLTILPSLQKFANSIEFLNSVVLGDSVYIGNDDRDVVYVHSSVAEVDTRHRETTHNPDGTIASIAEKDVNNFTVKLTSFSYDAAGNIASTAVTVGGKTITTTYDYDADGINTGTNKTVA
jgi:hypothetical protein